MLLWHLDAHLDANVQDFAFDNSFTPHKLIKLMEADGLEEIEFGSGGSADAGDYYTSGKSFGPSTNPSSKKYDGGDSLVEVLNISSSGLDMSSMFRVGSGDDGNGDLPELPVPVPLPPPRDAAISQPEEKDRFKLTVTTEGQYAIETGGQTDTYMSLFSSNNVITPIEENDDIGGGNLNSRIARNLSLGTYIVEVRHYSKTGTGPYTIRVRANN